MAYKKTQQEIEKIIEGGKLLGKVLEEISKMVKPGISAWEIDKKAEEMILEFGGTPAFKGYKTKSSDPPFPSTICASINEDLVHGIATKEKILKDGDIFSIDIGMKYPSHDGCFTDTALTIPVGSILEKTKELLAVTQKSLEIGIKQCKSGNTVADIGKAIQAYVDTTGFSIIRDLVGHGVGHSVHEEPRVPNFYDEGLESWKLEPGVVIAIEPMLSMGGYDIETAEDGWSISTVDKSLCAHFEHTVIITENEPIIVTRRPGELS
jgi:methionyl aminopeptidase